MKNQYLALLLLAWIQPVLAQIDINDSIIDSLSEIAPSTLIEENQILVRARYDGDSIIIRWAPNNPTTWLQLNKYGYFLERIEFDKENPDKDPKLTILKEDILPLDLDTWTPIAQANFEKNRYLAVGLQCIHGEWKSKTANSYYDKIEGAEELTNRYTFGLYAADMDGLTAEYAGLRWIDKNIEAEKSYLYRVRPNVPNDSLDIQSGVEVVYTVEKAQIPPIAVEIIEKDGQIDLRWNRAFYKKHYTAYEIEQSMDSINYTPINELPYVHALAKDDALYSPSILFSDSVTNYAPTYYRVRGHTFFGDMGPYSEPIKGMGRDRTPPNAPERPAANYLLDQQMEISWEYPLTSEPIKGFNVYKGSDSEMVIEKINNKIIPPNQRTFLDPNVNEFMDNYYLISAIDTAGNTAPSLVTYGMIIDTIPPQQPQGLTGAIDTNGLVTLTWEQGTDLDLLGYKVFFANAAYHEFSLITGHPIVGNRYQDTITMKTLTKNAYYKIIAVDKRFNYSIYSDVLALKRPDIQPPTAPLFTEYQVNKGEIYLKWVNSSSDDVAQHQLHRKEKGTTDWAIHVTFTDQTESYRDSSLIVNQVYDYRIIAIDSSGLVSEVVNPIQLKAIDFRSRPKVEQLQANFNLESTSAKLTWEYPFAGDYYFIIYRREENKGFQVAGKVKEGNAFEDKKVTKGKSYKYSIRVAYADGKKSGFCLPATLTTN